MLPNGTPQPKWFNRTIANAIRDRDRKHKSLGSMHLQRDIVEHKKLCRKVDKLVRKAESSEEKRVASATFDKAFDKVPHKKLMVKTKAH